MLEGTQEHDGDELRINICEMFEENNRVAALACVWSPLTAERPDDSTALCVIRNGV